MGELISQYQGTSANLFDNVGLMIGIAAIGMGIAGLIIWKAKSLSYNYRLLLAMLFFFAGIIVLGNAFFIKMARGPLANFEIYELGIITGKGSFYYKDFRDAYLYTDRTVSPINPNTVQKQMKVLIIELENGTRENFTEKNYPVEQLLADIQDAYANFRENK